MSKNLVRTVTTSMVGNLFEFYDFALFGYFAPIIGKLFFPAENETVQLISAFSVFAAGFLVRPIGGLIFGHIGDLFGRKKALMIAILLMAIPTAIIGILPTYSHIGVAGPILLVAMRMLQGISLGGNYSGSITFVTEHTDPQKRGFMGGLAVTSCLAGILLGSATAALFAQIFSDADLETFGWRIPFLLGVFICFIGFYMRRKVDESPEFLEEQKKPKQADHPLKEIFKKHKAQLTLTIACMMLHDLSFYLLFVYMTTYLTSVIGIHEDIAFTINTINLLAVSIITLGAAWLSDRFGRRKVLTVAAILFIVGTIPMMLLLNSKDTFIIFAAQLGLAFAVGGYFGPLPAMMIESFPTRVRYSASSLVTNISGPIFGGTAPALVTWLIYVTGSNLVPAFYLTGAAVISLIAVQFIKKVGKPIHHD